MDNLLDKPKDIRAGEELDRAGLESFLKDNISGLSGSLSIKQFPSGHSNLTYLLKVGDREMVLRRPPFGTKAKTAHDMAREYRILKALRPVFPYAPEPWAYTDDETVMGCPFYVMERIQGMILRRDLPLELALSADEVRLLFTRLLEALFDQIDQDRIAGFIHGTTHQTLQAHAVPGHEYTLFKGAALIIQIQVIAHVPDLNPFGIGSLGQKKLGLIRPHGPFLSVGDDRNSRLLLDPYRGLEHGFFIIRDLALAGADLDHAGLDTCPTNPLGNLGHEQLI